MLCGLQRRQLSVLERGGNVTLNTLRKVIGFLPNLEQFTFEQVRMKPTYIDHPAQRLTRLRRTAHLAPYVADMRRALGRVRKASPEAVAQKEAARAAKAEVRTPEAGASQDTPAFCRGMRTRFLPSAWRHTSPNPRGRAALRGHRCDRARLGALDLAGDDTELVAEARG